MQASEEIIIKVSPEIAQAYRSATDKQKQWFQTFMSLFFEQNLSDEIDFLGKVMDEISDRAVARGITPEILESILNE